MSWNTKGANLRPFVGGVRCCCALLFVRRCLNTSLEVSIIDRLDVYIYI